MMDHADLAIVGGGAAGLASAIFAAERAPAGHRIVVLDGAKQLGAKILVSGGARCNVTHHAVFPHDYNGSKNVVRNILAAFDSDATVRWFSSLGVELKREPTGKLFPVADTSRAVLNALLRRCEQLGIALRTDHRVSQIAPGESGFTLVHSRGELHAPRVVVCTGGRSLPRTGSDGAGWKILETLGHTVTSNHAALVPLVLDAAMFHGDLSGIALDVELAVHLDKKVVDRRTGSLLWTHFGISGPVAMDASRHWTTAQEAELKPRMTCNLLPGETFESVERWMIDAIAARPKAAILTLLTTRLPERVATALLAHVELDPALPAGQVPREARRALVHAMTALVLPVVQHRGWNYAEVTAGGVPLNEIDFRTMQSRKVPGLYLAGETLDCDGRIGGFNFQWAWATGHLAGRAAVEAASRAVV